MPTADFAVNASMQSENTLAAAGAWTDPDEAHDSHGEDDGTTEMSPQAVHEPARTLPDDLWQEWFGLWR